MHHMHNQLAGLEVGPGLHRPRGGYPSKPARLPMAVKHLVMSYDHRPAAQDFGKDDHHISWVAAIARKVEIGVDIGCCIVRADGQHLGRGRIRVGI